MICCGKKFKKGFLVNDNIKKELNKIFSLQALYQGIHEISIKNLKLLALVCFPQIEECSFELQNKQIFLTLYPKKGIKGFFLRKIHNRNNYKYESKFYKLCQFWLQGIFFEKNKSNLIIKWGKNEK